jgi:hypothetical protein
LAGVFESRVFQYAQQKSENEWTKILGWPGYRVYRSEINEDSKTLRLWVRRKRGNRKLECSGCSRRVNEIAESYQREVRDLPWSEYRTTPRTTAVIVLAQWHTPDTLGKTNDHDSQSRNVLDCLLRGLRLAR